MKNTILISIIILFTSCVDNDVGDKTEKELERDFYDDYTEIMDAMSLKIAHADTVVKYGDPITIHPELYIDDTKQLFKHYDIWYTIDKPMNLDSAHIDYDETYGAIKLEDSIVHISDTLTAGAHYISILCQLDVDAGFSITRNVKLEVLEN
jgi:hypothetical protein